MNKLKGILTLDMRYEFDLDDELFEDCDNVWDAVHMLVADREDLSDLCDRNKVKSVFYEGFEIIDESLRE